MAMHTLGAAAEKRPSRDLRRVIQPVPRRERLESFQRRGIASGSCASLVKNVRNQCALKLAFSLGARARVSTRVQEMKECCAAFYFCSLLMLTETESYRSFEIFITTEDVNGTGDFESSHAILQFRSIYANARISAQLISLSPSYL